MNTSLIRYLQSFILAHPPLAVFMMSVAAMTVSIFLVALNIKNKDLILDLHAIEDLKTFMTHLNEQILCINIPSTHQAPRNPTMYPALNVTGFKTKIHLLGNQTTLLLKAHNGTRNALQLSGSVNLKGWKRSCRHVANNISANNSNQDNTAFTLIIPPSSLDFIKNVSAESSNIVSACMYISGFPNLLPALATHPVLDETCQFSNWIGEEVGKMYPYDPAINLSAAGTCKTPNNSVPLSYDTAVLESNFFLTEIDRMHLFSNLLLAGYLSLGALSILILIAVLQGRNFLTIQHSILPTKEIMY